MLFTFQFTTLLLIKSIAFVKGISLQNDKLFMMKEFSSTPDALYRDQINNVNECKQISITNILLMVS